LRDVWSLWRRGRREKSRRGQVGCLTPNIIQYCQLQLPQANEKLNPETETLPLPPLVVVLIEVLEVLVVEVVDPEIVPLYVVPSTVVGPKGPSSVVSKSAVSSGGGYWPTLIRTRAQRHPHLPSTAFISVSDISMA
jgi:hypothetical protein